MTRSSCLRLIPSQMALPYALRLLLHLSELRSREPNLTFRERARLGREFVERMRARSEVQAARDRGDYQLQGSWRLDACSARRRPTARSVVGGVRGSEAQ